LTLHFGLRVKGLTRRVKGVTLTPNPNPNPSRPFLAFLAVRPNVLVIGVEAEDAAGMTASLKKGRLQPLEHVGLFADGAAVRADLDLYLSIYLFMDRYVYGGRYMDGGYNH